jgi:hypothetical protein
MDHTNTVSPFIIADSSTDAGRKNAPRLFADGPGVGRDAIHAKTAALALDFFLAALK